jgi:hypothetical protein
MSDEQQTPPPAPPANSAEAGARLDALTQDAAWGKKLLSGDVATTQEFHELSAMKAGGTSDIDVAMRGELPDVPSSTLKHMAGTAEMLRGMGFPPLSIQETLAGKEASQTDVDIATAWKNQHMKSPEFVKQYLAGEPDAVRQMMVADIILSSELKSEKAA